MTVAAIVARGDAAPVLEEPEHGLDTVATFVSALVAFHGDGTRLLTRPHILCALRQNCISTLHPRSGFVINMEDNDELIGRLYTKVGMIMEDAVEIALTIHSMEPITRREAMEQFEEVANQISVLLAAAKALNG